MTVSDDYKTFLADQLAGFGPVSIRRMFGGAGVYHQDLMFALIADDTLYFKAEEATQAAFEADGMGPFTYGEGGKRVVMSYWQAPDRLFDDPDELAAWARRAYEAALRSKGGKAKRVKPRGRRTKRPSSSPRART